MPEFSTRQKWIAAGTVAILVTAGIAYHRDFTFSGPTPRQARAALVERGWVDAGTPIIKRDGKVVIGRYECYLDMENGEPWCSSGVGFDIGSFRFQRTWDWCPFFGHWYVRRPWGESSAVG